MFPKDFNSNGGKKKTFSYTICIYNEEQHIYKNKIKWVYACIFSFQTECISGVKMIKFTGRHGLCKLFFFFFNNDWLIKYILNF